MKKKLTAVALVVCMLAVMLVGASLAYFTDTDSATNTFTVGNVKIQQNEQERTTDKDGKQILRAFTNEQTIMPAVYGATQSKEDVTVNNYTIKMRTIKNYVDKIISVTNTGSSDVYVRTFVAVPYNEAFETAMANRQNQSDEWLHTNCVTSSDTNPANGWYAGKDSNNEWPDSVSDRNTFITTIGGQKYEVRVYTNVNKLKASESTAPCFTGFYLDNDVDCETVKGANGKDTLNYYIMIEGTKISLGDISNLKIYAVTQAVQAEGFDDAWTALDAAFGTASSQTNIFTAAAE